MKKWLSAFFLGMTLFPLLAIVYPKKAGDSDDFDHFAYRTLVRAEAALKTGDSDRALEMLKTAVTRSSRYGRKGVSLRVLTRIASAGTDLFAKDPRAAWKYLSYYALASEDFGRASILAENWCLSHGATGPVFRYEIIRAGEPYTVWGSRFSREPLLEKSLEKMFLEKREEYEDKDLGTLVRGFIKTWRAPVRIISPLGMRSTEFEVAGLGTGQRLCVRTSRELMDTGFLKAETKGTVILKIPDQNRYVSFYELLVQCPYGSDMEIAVDMVKRYEQF